MSCKHIKNRLWAVGRNINHFAIIWCRDCGAMKDTSMSRWYLPKWHYDKRKTWNKVVIPLAREGICPECSLPFAICKHAYDEMQNDIIQRLPKPTILGDS